MPDMNPNIPVKKNDITLIVGRKGCGKSTLAGSLIKTARRLVVLDPQCEYEIGVKVNNFHDFADMVSRYRFSEDFKICYFPQDMTNRKKWFDVICGVVYNAGNLTFVVEELGIFMSATSFPEEFAKLVMTSRHKRISIIGITQRATKIPRDLRSQADRIYTFHQVEPIDLKYISEFMEMENVNRIKSLTNHNYILWLPDGTTAKSKLTC